MYRLRLNANSSSGSPVFYGGCVVPRPSRPGLLQINCAEGLWADSDHGVPAEQNSNAAIAARFLVLNRTDGGAFERLNRYETGLWRQLGQLLVTLEFLRQNVSL